MVISSDNVIQLDIHAFRVHVGQSYELMKNTILKIQDLNQKNVHINGGQTNNGRKHNIQVDLIQDNIIDIANDK